MTDANEFVRGEMLNIFLDMLDEHELHNLFGKKMDNMIREVIYFYKIFIYWIRSLCFSGSSNYISLSFMGQEH